MYQGFLYPILLEFLSEHTPTNVVAIASAIYPASNTCEAMERLMTILRKYIRYVNHIIATRSLIKCPMA